MRTLSLAAALALAAVPLAAQSRIVIPTPPAEPAAAIGLDRRHHGAGWDDDGWDDDDRRWRRRAGVEIVADRRRGWYLPGERPRMQLRTWGRVHLAVVHLDTDGRVEILWPHSPWGRDELRGGRTLSLWPTPARRGDGMGYVFAVASDAPLDFSRFGEWRGRGWRRDVRVWGDPDRAVRRITRALLDGDPHALLDLDVQGYRVGRDARYPTWACTDRGGWDTPRGRGGCDRVHTRLRRDPGYYDGGFGHRSAHGRRAEVLRVDGDDEGGLEFGGVDETRRPDADRDGVDRLRDDERFRPRVIAPGTAADTARGAPRGGRRP